MFKTEGGCKFLHIKMKNDVPRPMDKFEVVTPWSNAELACQIIVILICWPYSRFSKVVQHMDSCHRYYVSYSSSFIDKSCAI